MTTDRQRFIVITVLLTIFISYSFYLYAALPVKYDTPEKEVLSGKYTWQKYNCNACHQVYGLGGYLGPDLTNTYSLRGPAYIKAFLQNGTATMPNFDLNEKEVSALLAYLRDIAASGKGDPRTFTINNNGTIQQ